MCLILPHALWSLLGSRSQWNVCHSTHVPCSVPGLCTCLPSTVLSFPNISVLWVLITQHGTSLTPLGIWCMVSGPKPYQLSQDSHFSKFPTWCVWTLKLERCYSRFLFPRTGTILLCSYFLLWTSLCFFSVPESIIGSFEAHSWKHPLKKGLLDGG